MNIELERLKLQVKRVSVSKDEMEFKILERLEDIERLKREIENQQQTILDLEEKIKGKENG